MSNPLEYLLSKKSVALFPHVNPDWDAYGSALALRAILRKRGVLCDIVLDSPLPFHLNFADTDALVFDENENYFYECFCAVDLNSKGRLGKREALFMSHGDRVCIDHHIEDGEKIAQISEINPKAAATAEVIYSLMKELSIPVEREDAAHLFCAVSSDTGSFRYSNVTLASLELFGEILKTGCDTAKLSNLLYFRSTYPAMKLKAMAIEAIELFEDGKIGICTITDEMIKEAGAVRDDAGEFSDLPRNVHTVLVSAVIKESGRCARVSLRAKGNINVMKIAALFGGGGHEKAAGATIEGSCEKAKELLLPQLIKAVRD